MRTRKGATLVEVLVAIFIMGIGLLSLLVLFPLGALTMAEAIQNDRAAHLAANAASVARLKEVRDKYDPNPDTSVGATYADPDNGNNPGVTDPSNPIYIDPIGFSLNTGGSQPHIGTSPGKTSNIQR